MEFPWYLNEENFFFGLGAEKKLFMALAKKREVKKNEVLFSAGELGTSAFYLHSGEVGISHITAKGKESIVFIRQAGELFGLAEVIGGAERACNARAITPCCLFEIKKSDLEQLLSRHWALSKRVMESLGSRLRYLGEQLENLISCDVTTRLLKLLFYLSCQGPKNIAGDRSVTLPIKLTQEQIAAMIGSCQQTVSEILKQLEENGLIRISRNRREITILKPSKFAKSF
jgi:CRP/FNR family transcriptional regulator